MQRVVAHARGNVVGYLALFVALSTGAYAAVQLPANSVGSKQLKRGAVKRSKLARNAVIGAQVADGSLTGADINEATLGTVPSADQRHDQPRTPPTPQRHQRATNAAQLGGAGASAYLKAAGTISAGDLTGTYGAPTIAPGAVTGAKVAANSLTGANIDESTLSGIGAGVMTGRLNVLSSTLRQRRPAGRDLGGDRRVDPHLPDGLAFGRPGRARLHVPTELSRPGPGRRVRCTSWWAHWRR